MARHLEKGGDKGDLGEEHGVQHGRGLRRERGIEARIANPDMMLELDNCLQ